MKGVLLMIQRIPSFIDSPYFVEEPFNWHLTEDAPDDIKKEFEEYMKSMEIIKKVVDSENE